MKKKFIILNFFLAATVFFSMLFQFVHSYEHIAKQLSEKECHHKYSSRHEITHQHHELDHCYVCNFKVASFIPSTISFFQLEKTSFSPTPPLFKSTGLIQFFAGSLFGLRAPPKSF